MRQVKFSPLELSDSQVRIEWTVEPSSPIYRETSFVLDFGDAMDPRDLPLKLWWTVVLLIIHPHWNLLRPCRVVLPVTLEPGEIEFWLRLLDQERVTLEKCRGTTDFERTIEIECLGPRLADEALPPAVDRWATAFSGGRDSLVQTGLLCELTTKPLLVNTCSPMPPLIDHESPFRQRALDEIRRRRDVELVVVKSNLRSIWPHYEAPHQLGYKISMGQLGDPYLVTATTLAVAASRGIRSFTLATELDEGLSEEYHGRLAFYDFNIAYAPPMLTVIDRLAKRFGMNFSSLLLPFNHFQVQKLLRKRYSDLAHLQISCFFMEKASEQSCSHCLKCIRGALLLLAMREDPRTIGIDLESMFTSPYHFEQVRLQRGDAVRYAASKIDRSYAHQLFARRGLLERLRLRTPAALSEFEKIVDRLATIKSVGIEETHLDHFRHLPEALSESIKSISLEYWPEIDGRQYETERQKIEAAVDWITGTL